MTQKDQFVRTLLGRSLIGFLGIGLLLTPRLQADDSPSLVRVAIMRDVKYADALAMLAKRDYQGSLRLVPGKSGLYTAINTLDVEDFLLGVLGCEMDPTAPLEALKAQAIAARAHALYEASTSESPSYDLVANLSQAYRGRATLHKNVVLAIESTRGQVLYYQGHAVPAFFHASCGGHTEAMANVWPTALKVPGTADCPYCSKSTENKWNFTLSASALQKILTQAGIRTTADFTVAIQEKSESGHIISLAISDGAKKTILSAEKFRALAGYHSIKSTLFNLQRPPKADGSPGDKFVFQGDGFGHGVGLCQFGAQEMAEHGSRCEEILFHYFPQSKIGEWRPETLISAR